MDKIIADLKAELEQLREQYRMSLGQITRYVEEHNAKLTGHVYSEHFGHNLGSYADELTRLSGRISQTQNILSHVENNA